MIRSVFGLRLGVWIGLWLKLGLGLALGLWLIICTAFIQCA